MAIKQSIEEIQKEKRELEISLLNAIIRFQDETGLVVERVDLMHSHVLGKTPMTQVVSVSVDVKL